MQRRQLFRLSVDAVVPALMAGHATMPGCSDDVLLPRVADP